MKDECEKRILFTKRIAFLLMAVVVLCMAIATFLEHFRGTDYVLASIYGTVWFDILWGLLVFSGMSYCVMRKLYRRYSIFLLHISFVIILLGALITHVTAQRGTLHLRVEESKTAFVLDEKEGLAVMPFSVTLRNFTVKHYMGTEVPSDYVSSLVLSEGGSEYLEEVSMNKIVNHDGLRFYQTSYDTDEQGSLFTVYKDPWGIPVTYAGYFLFFFSMIWMLISPQGNFRKLLKNPIFKRMMCCLVFMLMITSVKALPTVLSKEQAVQFSDVQVYYDGRIAPLQTLSRDFILKLTGHTSYKGLTSEQFLTGWLFYPQEWEHEPFLKVDNKLLRQQLSVNKEAAFTDFFTDSGDSRLSVYGSSIDEYGKKSALEKAISDLNEKIQLISMLRSGTLLRVFPIRIQQEVRWVSPVDNLQQSGQSNAFKQITELFGTLYKSITDHDNHQFSLQMHRLKTIQRENGGSSVLSPARVKAEIIYNHCNVPDLFFKINLTAGLIAFIFFMASKGTKIKKRLLQITPMVVKASFISLTIYLFLRAYISGRLPLGNGFETMVFTAWCINVVALLFYRRFFLIAPFALLMSGFCLLVATMGSMNPRITPLVPVLDSPLLSFHVCCIMMSYALLSFTFLNGLSALFLYICGHRQKDDMEVMRLTLMSKFLLYPAIVLLGCGIFIGAIWANVSWGQYWSWDPKEVWALISFLVYAVAMHDHVVCMMRRPYLFHLYMILAFFTLLMTFFGVNFFLGGMHSYANG